MGGGDDSGKQGQQAVASQEVALAQKQDARADELHQLSLPGFKKSEDYYSTIASGDPNAIQRAIAPATEQINQKATANKEQMRSNMGRGGEERLAESLQDISSTGDVGRLATQSYTGAFPALATLSGQGMGLSLNNAATALTGLGNAGKTYDSMAANNSADKASTMGFMGSMAGAGGQMAAMGCWIAEELYGAQDERTHTIRTWVNYVWPQRSIFGKIVIAIYLRYGIRAAAVVRKNRLARFVARIAFDAMLVRARLEFNPAFGLEVMHEF